jgi:hypothetical protein
MKITIKKTVGTINVGRMIIMTIVLKNISNKELTSALNDSGIVFSTESIS